MCASMCKGSCAITLCEVHLCLPLCNSALWICFCDCVPNLLQVLGDNGLSQFRQVLGHLGTVARSGAGYTWISDPYTLWKVSPVPVEENLSPWFPPCKQATHTFAKNSKESVFYYNQCRGTGHRSLKHTATFVINGEPAEFVKMNSKDTLRAKQYVLIPMLSMVLSSDTEVQNCNWVSTQSIFCRGPTSKTWWNSMQVVHIL